MKKAILLIVGIVLSCLLYSQNKEKVLVPELQSEYSGEEKKGLAHGIGEAKGMDHYKGEFKKGIPHGEGTYTWNDGQVYKGEWKRGIKEGYGKLSFKIGEKDSVLEGYFYQDVFLGDKKRPDPDYVIDNTINVARNNFLYLNETGDRVVISFDSQGRTPTKIIHQSSSGTYKFETPTKLVYSAVEYPFTLSLNYNIYNAMKTNQYECRFKFTLNKPGTWQVKLGN